jgi:hypothetical protein
MLSPVVSDLFLVLAIVLADPKVGSFVDDLAQPEPTTSNRDTELPASVVPTVSIDTDAAGGGGKQIYKTSSVPSRGSGVGVCGTSGELTTGMANFCSSSELLEVLRSLFLISSSASGIASASFRVCFFSGEGS